MTVQELVIVSHVRDGHTDCTFVQMEPPGSDSTGTRHSITCT